MSIQPASVYTEHEARQITERIRVTAITARDSLEKLQHLLAEARDGEVWSVLGYTSWTAYLADVMGEQPLRLPRDQRQEIVGYLAGEGMSTRAIAPIVGASHMQVARDVAAVTNVTPAPLVNAVTGEVSDDYDHEFAHGAGGSIGPGNAGSLTCECGFTLSWPDGPDEDRATMLRLFAEHETGCDEAELPAEASPAHDAGPHAGPDEDEPGSATPSNDSTPAPVQPEGNRAARTITGLDGKAYRQQPAPKAKRRPLPDAFRDATYDLTKVTERIERLAADDRFPRNANEVAERNLNYLVRARDLLEQVIQQLNTQENTDV